MDIHGTGRERKRGCFHATLNKKDPRLSSHHHGPQRKVLAGPLRQEDILLDVQAVASPWVPLHGDRQTGLGRFHFLGPTLQGRECHQEKSPSQEERPNGGAEPPKRRVEGGGRVEQDEREKRKSEPVPGPDLRPKKHQAGIER